jgi:hypothetical protein
VATKLKYLRKEGNKMTKLEAKGDHTCEIGPKESPNHQNSQKLNRCGDKRLREEIPLWRTSNKYKLCPAKIIWRSTTGCIREALGQVELMGPRRNLKTDFIQNNTMVGT